MQISDVSRLLGISPRVIRHYEVAGLLQPSRFENGYRRFSKADVQRVGWIRDLIGAGFSTREIARLTACLEDGAGDGSHACTLALQSKLTQIDHALVLLTTRRRVVAERLAALRTTTERAPTTDPRPARRARRSP
ncbi:MAG TPA: MerR family transcriptional regulator [Vineibacter sp.]|nr:MerR family transcriptional regulator [Vineibacter sp.]